MSRTYSHVIQGDQSRYSTHVPELPAILVTGKSVDEVTERASEVIKIYWDAIRTERSPSSQVTEIQVELPA